MPTGGTPAPPPPPPDFAPPPGYVGYGQPGAVTPTRRTRPLAKSIVVMTTIVAVATILTAILSASLSTDAEAYLDGRLGEDDFRDALGPLSTVQLLAGLATLATGILTMIWMYRVATNLRSLGRRTTWNPLFAVFGWFLPPLVLYIIPFLMLRELWKASDPEAVGDERWRKSGENPALWVWFALFGILPTILVFIQASSLATDGLPNTDLEAVADGLDGFGLGGWFVALTSVVAAVTWILVVRQLTDRHARLTGET